MRITTIRLNATLLSTVLAAALGAGLPATSAQAAAIVGADGVSSDVGTLNRYRIGSLVNQNGLSNGYTSGVTDFASFVATTTHDAIGETRFGNFWAGTAPVGVLTFAFSAPVVLDGLALWNYVNDAALKDFRLLDGNGNLLGSYSTRSPAIVHSQPAQVFEFAAFSGTSIALAFDTNHGGLPIGPAIGEVAFRASTMATTLNTGNPDPAAAVPEPGSFALAGLALAGLALTRRRRG